MTGPEGLSGRPFYTGVLRGGVGDLSRRYLEPQKGPIGYIRVLYNVLDCTRGLSVP